MSEPKQAATYIYCKFNVCTSSSFPSTPSESEGHHMGTETKRHKKCFTGHWGRVENPVTVNACGTRSGN